MLNAEFLPRQALEKLGFASLGRNARIHPSCVFVGCSSISIGDDVRIDPFCVITANAEVRIGSNVHISAQCSIVGAAGVVFGEFANLSHGVRVFSESDDLAASALIGAQAPRTLRAIRSAPLIFDAFSCIGAASVVLPGVTIGEGATLGALSLAREDLAPWSVNAGCPSRKIGTRDREAVLKLAREFVRD